MLKLKILVPIGCRSDEGLSKPLIRRLKETNWCECEILQLQASNYLNSFVLTSSYLKQNHIDLVLITGDRVEMTACACASYHNNVKVAHFYSGIIDESQVFDDSNRHVITLYSDIQFCENKKAKIVTENLLKSIKKKPNVFIVGISHLDDIEICEAKVPIEDYDLVLLNSITLTNEELHWEHKRKEIIIGGNPDGENPHNLQVDYNNLPRHQFLGLLKNCERFITNSSCAYYEAPYFLKPEQIILLGKRNKKRATRFNEIEFGASDKVVKILKKYLNNKHV